MHLPSSGLAVSSLAGESRHVILLGADGTRSTRVVVIGPGLHFDDAAMPDQRPRSEQLDQVDDESGWCDYRRLLAHVAQERGRATAGGLHRPSELPCFAVKSRRTVPSYVAFQVLNVNTLSHLTCKLILSALAAPCFIFAVRLCFRASRSNCRIIPTSRRADKPPLTTLP